MSCKNKNEEALTITQNKFLQNTNTFGFNELIETQFNYLFVSYVRAFNKVYQRKGGMFNKPFRCIELGNDAHFTQLIVYIHSNPLKHKLMKDFTRYKWSSYNSIIATAPTMLMRNDVLEWFGGRERFIEVHRQQTVYYYDHEFGGE